MLELTWYVSVTILKGVEVVHEFFDGDLEGLEQAGVFKEPVGDLKHKNQIVKSLIFFAMYNFAIIDIVFPFFFQITFLSLVLAMHIFHFHISFHIVFNQHIKCKRGFIISTSGHFTL